MSIPQETGAIGAYDLARDIARELDEHGAAIVTGLGFSKLYAGIDQDKTVRIVEALIQAALKSGGIRP